MTRLHNCGLVLVMSILLITQQQIMAKDEHLTQAPKPGPVIIHIDGALLLQQIDGFGSSAVVGFEGMERGAFDEVVPFGVSYRTSAKQRQAILETAIRELGASHLRIWLWPPGIEETNDNDDPAVMNWGAFNWKGQSGRPASRKMMENRSNGIHEWGVFLTQALPLGLKTWILTPGALPEWMRQGRYADPKNPERLEEYAEWAAAHVLYLKKTFGLEAPYWSMANEPDTFMGEQSPALWIAMIKATGARFRKEGLQTKIMFPDYMNVYAAVPLATEVLKNDEARGYIGALAYHHYRASGDGPRPFLDMVGQAETANSGRLFDQVTRGARLMAELGQKYGLPSWQTETGYYINNTRGMNEWEVGRGRANEIYYELSAGASAVEGMCLFWPDAMDVRYHDRNRSEGHHILLTTDGKSVVHWEVSKDAGAVFAHYARFVHPGDRRVLAECGDPLLRVTAFASEKDRRYVAVVVNNAGESKHVEFRLTNLHSTPRHAGGLLTDATRMLEAEAIRRVPGLDSAYEAQLPPLSLTTFLWTETDPGKMTLPEGISKR